MNSSDEVVFTPVCEDALKPFKGKCFITLDEGVEFYKHYARNVGFDIRLAHSTKIDNVVIWKYVVCNREGNKFINPNTLGRGDLDENLKVRRRISSRCGCKAKISFKFVGCMGYIIHDFVEEHNHELVEVEHRQFMKINRKLDPVHRQFILDCCKSDIGPTAAHNLLSELMGGDDNIGFSVLEVRNFARDMKAFADGCDAQMLQNEMRKRKELCELFFYEYEIDADDKLTRLFWCDPISRMNYQIFGDIVAFDTTYSTNKYCMIFAPFTGKDNHGKPVTFAAGLLSKEDASSFVWLFEKFIACMGYAPKLIITDQDLGMKVAVERVFNSTRHRWCMWHIMLKLADKVLKQLRADEDFKKDLNACVLSELIEPEVFEYCWDEIMTTFELDDHPWFLSMFENKEYWVPTYFRDYPMSSLVRTTSISECENSFYKRNTRSRSNLLEFWMHFNNALDVQRHQSSRLNYLDKSFCPSFCTKAGFEKHASSLYTAKIFKSVQDEITSARDYCHMLDFSKVDGREMYKIVDEFKDINVVHYDEIGPEFICSCKMFSRMGLLCSHVFYVMKNKQLLLIPEKYIVRRWMKTHLVQQSSRFGVDSFESYVRIDESMRLKNNIMQYVYGLTQMFDGDVDRLSKLLAVIDDGGKSISMENGISNPVDKRQMFGNFYGQDLPEEINIHPPNVVKTKGSGSRFVSRQEKAARMKEKPQRRFRKCNQIANHDSKNCGKNIDD